MVAFKKMHGLGNDFVIIDGRSNKFSITKAQIIKAADRHFGIGCDQLIVIEKANNDSAYAFMRIYNPDGSQAEACGNATRCVASLLIAETEQNKVIIETLHGILPTILNENGMISVDMGKAQLNWADIPLSHEIDTCHLGINIGPLNDGIAVGMGNPHCVFFVDDVMAINLSKFGSLVENHPLFPDRTNVEIASINNDGSINLRVWERGAGLTLACGSGACATMVAANLRGLVGRKADIKLDGGILHIRWLENNHILMTGPVATAFTGKLNLDELTISDTYHE